MSVVKARRTTSDFKSPKHKLISLFHSARDKWRERARAYRQLWRAMSVTARDLRKSRDSWKQKYKRERAQRLALAAQLGQRSAPGEKFSRLVTAAASRLQ